MSIYFNVNRKHSVIAANSHYYKIPTEERYIDRTLKYHDFIYILDGKWAITEDQKNYPLEKGDVLLLAAGKHHYTSMPCQAGTRTFCMHISCEDGDLEEREENIALPTLLHLRREQNIKRYFEDIVTIYWSESEYKQERLSALVELLMWELKNAYQQSSHNDTDLADQAIELLASSPHRRFKVEEAAQMLFVSEKTLNNAMRQKTGMPFYAYQKNMKLEMAASQIKMEPEMRISEIASALGFYDQFHFSKAFKEKFGVSPQNYKSIE